MIPYIQLADGVLHITLSKGTIIINPYTVNYRKILRGLEAEAITEEELQALRSEPCTDGLFYAYNHKGSLLVIHATDNAFIVTDANGNHSSISSFNYPPLGTYTSRGALINDFPEYFI